MFINHADFEENYHVFLTFVWLSSPLKNLLNKKRIVKLNYRSNAVHEVAHHQENI